MKVANSTFHILSGTKDDLFEFKEAESTEDNENDQEIEYEQESDGDRNEERY